MRPNLSFDKFAAVLATLGASAAMACGGSQPQPAQATDVTPAVTAACGPSGPIFVLGERVRIPSVAGHQRRPRPPPRPASPAAASTTSTASTATTACRCGSDDDGQLPPPAPGAAKKPTAKKPAGKNAAGEASCGAGTCSSDTGKHIL